MRSRKQGRWLTPFRLVMVAGLGILGTLSWKYEWIPLHLGSAPTGALRDASENSAAGGPDQSAQQYVEPVLAQETIVAQSEPPAEALSEGNDNQRSYQIRDIEVPRIYKRTLTGEVVESAPEIDSPVNDAIEPKQFKASAQPLFRDEKPLSSQQSATDRNTPQKLNPPEGIKRASAPVIKTAKHASFKEEVGGDQAENASPDLIAIDQLIQQGKIIDAHKQLSKIYWNQPQLYPVIKSRITETARMIYFAPQPHFMTPHEIEPGDQLRKVATQYHITWEYLAKINQIDPKKIRPGQKLKVIKGPFSAFVDLSDFTMTVHAHGYFVKRYPIGTGKDHSTPTGKFQVKEKLVDPTYYGPDGVIANDDPTNPLGERWIDLGDSYGIHGTIDPASIGKAESRGCVRLLNEDVAEVYDLLGVNSEVVIRP